MAESCVFGFLSKRHRLRCLREFARGGGGAASALAALCAVRLTVGGHKRVRAIAKRPLLADCSRSGVAVGLMGLGDSSRKESFIHALHGCTPLVHSLPLRNVGIKLLLLNANAFAQVPFLHRQAACRKWRNLHTGLEEDVDVSTRAGHC